MRPKKSQKTLEIFKVRLEEIINKDYPLVKLADVINWKELEVKLSKKLKTYLGRVYRDIMRSGSQKDEVLLKKLSLAERLLSQNKNSKNKLYSIDSPEVECISKGKAHKRYEFGSKVSMVTTSKSNWIVAIEAHHGNLYDGHTLKSSIEKAASITNWQAKNVNVDLGYRGNDYDREAQVNIVNRLKMKNQAKSLVKWLKRRSAIKPIFGHLKSGNRPDRNLLNGKEGDQINAVLAAYGFNLRKLYAVYLLPILKWLKNQLIEKYFFFKQKLSEESKVKRQGLLRQFLFQPHKIF